jgi:TonB family protein
MITVLAAAHRLGSRWCCLLVLLALGAGCAGPSVQRRPVPPAEPPPGEYWREVPGPDGPWRPHLLSRCEDLRERPPAAVDRSLAVCADLYRAGEGSDAIAELELLLRTHPDEGLVLLTLGQLYLMAGQGEPELMPSEGPARDVGDWDRNQERLLARAEALLREAGRRRPDDGAVDYLLADVARARGDLEAAARLVDVGAAKCTLPASLRILKVYQGLFERPARLEQSVAPDYPLAAREAGLAGEVVLDLLISPRGAVVQLVPVASPGEELTRAAAAALSTARFTPARVGKYPVWSWLRVPTRFSLVDG